MSFKCASKDISINSLFPQLQRQPRAQILMYVLYTAVFRAVLSCTHKKILINSVILKFTVRILFAILFISLVACSDEADEDNLVNLHIVASQDVISIEIPLALNETTFSINSEFNFTLQGLKSNGVDTVTITRDIEWSLSAGAASSIDQQGHFTAGATAENITLTAKFGLFTDSIDIRVSSAKFDRVDQLHESVFSVNMCQSQVLQPVGRYVDENGDVEIRAVDSVTIKNIEWVIVNQQDGSLSQRAYIEATSGNQTILHTLSAGNIIVQAKAISLVTNTSVTVDFDQSVSSELNSIKLCLSSNADLNSCVVTDPGVEQDKVLSFMAVGNYQAADGSNFNQNITRNSQWGISNIANASIAFSSDRRQLDVTGVKEDTIASLSVACGDILQSLDSIDIADGVALDTAVSCGAPCVDSSVEIDIDLLSVLSFDVTANIDIDLTDEVSITLDSRPDEISLVVQVNLSNGDLSTITDDGDLAYIIIPVDDVDVIESKVDSGVFTVLGAGTAKVLLIYRGKNFTAVIEVP